MIPKKIHYIWLGGKEEPKILQKCKASWKKYCPEYEIIRWDESNLNINCCEYCKNAYEAKKFAFASDVLRFDILSHEGGIYLDIDVELIKPIDDILDHKIICGFENGSYIAPGLILGCEKGNELIKELYDEYKTRSFATTPGMKNQVTICSIFTDKLKARGFKINNTLQEIDGIALFPSEYFCPKNMTDGRIKTTENTYSIHHYASTWVPKCVVFKNKMLQFMKRILGEKLVNKLRRKKHAKESKSCQCDNSSLQS